jgi:hypothetical protein
MALSETVAVRIDDKTIILVKREKYEELGAEGCRRWFIEHRSGKNADVNSLSGF